MSDKELNFDGDLEKTDFAQEISEDEQASSEEFADDIIPYEDETEDTGPSFADELENYLPTPENTDKIKKPYPAWLISAVTAFAVCVAVLTIYSL
ncbi:MAG: hypothetical protein IKR46_04120, partial [Clostridia bacterium]|nr:hypothetical protein [Clostridia bacterium]